MTTIRLTTALLSLALLGPAAPVRAQSATQSLAELEARAAALRDRAVGIGPAVAAMSAQVGALGRLSEQLAELNTTERLAALDALRYGVHSTLAIEPRAAWAPQDPADSLYRAARGALNRGNNGQAAYLFREIHDRHPRSSYAADAFYWEAYARYRDGSTTNLNTALDVLRQQQQQFPNAATRGDADALMVRIQSQLARRGNSEAAETIRTKAEQLERTAREVSRTGEAASRDIQRQARRSRSSCNDEDDERMAALNALLQMDADRALPILGKVMARRDEGSICLRRKAVFLIAQHSGPGAEAMLLEAVRSDPDQEVRENGVFWLSQVNTEHATLALDSILKSSTDQSVQEKAIFALSQQSSRRAAEALRDFAMRANAPSSLREKAIFWLGQSGRNENLDFLKSIYRTTTEPSLKEKIIFALAQGDHDGGQQWLLDLAGNQQESIELRKKALFWLGQSGASMPELFSLYDKFTDRDLREQLIFVYSQRHETQAIDKLMEIARTDRDPELRKKALFWLSQSDDPRVAKLLEEIITKP
jgi:TolA-binding protein